LLLAQSGRPALVKTPEELRSALGTLPIRLLPLAEKKRRQLYNTGVRVLRDLWRLPKEALARRFGADLVNYLEQALGRVPDPRLAFHSPEFFVKQREWPFEINDQQLILTVSEELLDELAVFLRERDACINACYFSFYHAARPPTMAPVGVRRATRDAGHLLLLLKEHLNRFELPAPVTGMKLRAGQLQDYTTQSASLLIVPPDEPGPNAGDFVKLLEQLQARLGREAIQGLHTLEDHRPEYAQRLGEWMAAKSALFSKHRPLWLLPQPQPLKRRHNRLYYQGPVTILAGPERIESGWWAEQDIRRDYYLAMDKGGGRLWIFRDLKSEGCCKWYLHGLFA
jgi:protein ImuB